jgi:5-methylcytosine-specific restriction endonuclease McrA|tara:strand:- start:1759 stop:2118 length:360 start_codon:yes stop_codon:yes gene_type:complete
VKRNEPLKRGKPLKRGGSLRPRSKKKSKQYVERRKTVSRLLAERPYCEACPVFAVHDEVTLYTRRASVDIHELKRRSQGGSILDDENLLAVCRECHDRIGNHPKLAIELKLALPGWWQQ